MLEKQPSLKYIFNIHLFYHDFVSGILATIFKILK